MDQDERLQARVDHNNRRRRSLRWRIRLALYALRGLDAIPDQGIQRIGPEGRIHTCAKLPIAMWIPTDDSDIAHAELGAQLEKAFSKVDWAQAPGDDAKSTGDLIEARFGANR